jgi:hypothetical protein
MGPAVKGEGMIAGYPSGVAPPSGGAKSWYTANRTVVFTFSGAKPATVVVADQQAPASLSSHALDRSIYRSTTARVRMINSTCANPKALWVGELNSVTWPDASQLEKLRVASEMCEESIPVAWTAWCPPPHTHTLSLAPPTPILSLSNHPTPHLLP